MQEVLKLIIAIVVLALGIPIGNYLAKITKEELKDGKKWFNAIIILCFSGAVVSLIFKSDFFLFTCLFIAIVTKGSLKSKFRR